MKQIQEFIVRNAERLSQQSRDPENSKSRIRSLRLTPRNPIQRITIVTSIRHTYKSAPLDGTYSITLNDQTIFGVSQFDSPTRYPSRACNEFIVHRLNNIKPTTGIHRRIPSSTYLQRPNSLPYLSLDFGKETEAHHA